MYRHNCVAFVKSMLSMHDMIPSIYSTSFYFCFRNIREYEEKKNTANSIANPGRIESGKKNPKNDQNQSIKSITNERMKIEGRKKHKAIAKSQRLRIKDNFTGINIIVFPLPCGTGRLGPPKSGASTLASHCRHIEP